MPQAPGRPGAALPAAALTALCPCRKKTRRRRRGASIRGAGSERTTRAGTSGGGGPGARRGRPWTSWRPSWAAGRLADPSAAAATTRRSRPRPADRGRPMRWGLGLPYREGRRAAGPPRFSGMGQAKEAREAVYKGGASPPAPARPRPAARAHLACCMRAVPASHCSSASAAGLRPQTPGPGPPRAEARQCWRLCGGGSSQARRPALHLSSGMRGPSRRSSTLVSFTVLPHHVDHKALLFYCASVCAAPAGGPCPGPRGWAGRSRAPCLQALGPFPPPGDCSRGRKPRAGPAPLAPCPVQAGQRSRPEGTRAALLPPGTDLSPAGPSSRQQGPGAPTTHSCPSTVPSEGIQTAF